MAKLHRKELPAWAKMGHKKPVTRRDFLAHGIIPFAASALVPGALGLLVGPAAVAQSTICPADGSGMPAFITLNLSGGAAIASNWLPRDAGGQLLSSYSKMGGGTAANLTPVNQFGVNQFNATSPFLAGLLTSASALALANTAFVGVCVQSRDDTVENKFDASGMAFRAGVTGSKVPNLGTTSSATGLAQQAATVVPPPPLIVRSFNDLANSIGYTAALKNALSTPQKALLTKLVQNLSSSQTRKLASISTAARVQSLVECAGLKIAQLISAGAAAVDPVTNAPAVAALWNFNAATDPANQGRVFGSMVYNGLAGNAGTVNLELGGYDYHDNTRSTGDGKDREAGVTVGQILESAKVMGKSIFIYVTSDGSVVSNDSATPGSPWVSDRGSAGSAMIFLYSPNGRPATIGAQIGEFTSGQVANDKTLVGANPEIAAQAVIANYLKFAARSDLFHAIAPLSPLIGSALQGVVKVA